MKPEVLTQAEEFLNNYVLPFGRKPAGAVAVWIVGGWVIRLVRLALGRGLLVRNLDTTLSRYVEAGANVLLKLLLFVAVLSVLGTRRPRSQPCSPHWASRSHPLGAVCRRTSQPGSF